MLKIENITKKYREKIAVNNLNFEVKEGEIFGLLGLNGAGKTTTFRMILGLIDDYTGKITLNGKKIDYSITDDIGFLTEEQSLLPKLTVYEQAVYYGKLKSMKISVIDKRLDELLDRFNIKEYKYKKIKELSKGNKQKISFILAIIHKPKLLILDEPFSGLDPINVELFKTEIQKLKEKNTIIIFSSHRMEHVELFCEKLLILKDGKCVLSGDLKKIKEDYQKKNVIINGNINVKEIIKQKGVCDIKKEGLDYIVSLENKEYVQNLFEYITKYDNITKFTVLDASLNEIFIAKVGEEYEK